MRRPGVGVLVIVSVAGVGCTLATSFDGLTGGVPAGDFADAALDDLGSDAGAFDAPGPDAPTIDAPADRVTSTSCVAQITAGWSHTCARKADGSVWCWGNNNASQLGVSNVSQIWTPTAVSGLSGHAMSIAAGDSFTCAALVDGTVECWGYDDAGQLGRGDASGTSATPAPVIGVTGAKSVVAGASHACALTTGGAVWCWGDNSEGELGDGSFTSSTAAVQVQGLAGVTQIAAGWNHTCALGGDGQVRCWGQNDHGQLGDGTTTHRATADVAVVLPNGGSGTNATSVAAGFYESCAVRVDGTAWCWGDNNRGQLGDGTTNDAPTPVQLKMMAKPVQLSISGYVTIGPVSHACGLGSDGAVWCWGANPFGELGDDTTTDRPTPISVPAFTSDVAAGNGAVAIGVGAKHSCAIFPAGVRCWGANDVGQLGNGSQVESHVPVAAMLSCP